MIKPKRSLGQNFLIDESIIDLITNIINIENRNILEVGPGTGNLTSAILKKNPKKFIVIEKDNRLADEIEKKFKGKVEIINDDILSIDEDLIHKNILTVFGNLPYNISTEILCKWILNLNYQNLWFDYLILMFQKEVADRILASSNTKYYGRLSILSNWKLDIKKVCDVKPSSFFPQPKIDSTILFFKPKKKYFNLKDATNLEKITRVFFMHRRKMIKKPYIQLFKKRLNVASELKIDLNLRPQNLNLETYLKLASEYEKLRG
ncbi:16S rRNA (adenine(1518)-N(6)/adenine(1519)-N(6))-dimethyltransferase RsmA [Candidatus Pelagibacter sp.]|nr:16S rRNA (adenine(1518)-N(6)/adenine(1519)-N(6))-dimethyltransferase RsmA [Candidatus Pelagibacter sp.]